MFSINIEIYLFLYVVLSTSMKRKAQLRRTQLLKSGSGFLPTIAFCPFPSVLSSGVSLKFVFSKLYLDALLEWPWRRHN